MVKLNTEVVIRQEYSQWTVRSESYVWDTFNTLKEACSYCEECEVTYQIID